MEEQIYNIYLEINDGIIRQFGVIDYTIDGTDEEKFCFLKKSATDNWRDSAKYFKIPDRYRIISESGEFRGVLRYEKYEELTRIGKEHEVFFEMLNEYESIERPLMCITPVIDGKIKIDGQINMAINEDEIKEIKMFSVADYLKMYLRGDKFYVSELLNDDFFEPIKLLSNNHYYMNATKLLLSAIDTFAFLEFGDKPGNFVKWTNAYLDLSKLHISSEELWELRNSVLHMTNYNSRKVKSGEVKCPTIVIGYSALDENNIYKTLNFHDLYIETAKGTCKWHEILFAEKNRIKDFIERYDLIVSDKRMGYIQLIR